MAKIIIRPKYGKSPSRLRVNTPPAIPPTAEELSGVVYNFAFPELRGIDPVVNTSTSDPAGLLFSSSRLQLPNFDYDLRYTVSAFAKVVPTANAANQTLFTIFNVADVTNRLTCVLNTTTVVVTFTSGGTTNTATANITYSALDELKILVYMDAYYINVWVNGTKTQVKRTAQLKFNSATSGVIIGDSYTTGNYFNGTIKNFLLLDCGVSDARATAINAGTYDTRPGQFDKFKPQRGIPFTDNLVDGNPYFNSHAELSIVYFAGQHFQYFTIYSATPSNWIDVGIGVATADNPEGPYTLYGNDAIIGSNRGYGGLTTACGSYAIVSSDEGGPCVLLYLSVNYISPNAGSKIYKSYDGFNFTLVGNFLPAGTPAYTANISIYPVQQSNGYYYGIGEGLIGGVWKDYLVRSTSLTTGWEVVQLLSSLEYQSGFMYGGPTLMKSGTKWLLWIHVGGDDTGTAASNLPTRGAYYECDEVEPINWVFKELTMEMTDVNTDGGATLTDQTADFFIYPYGNKVYITWSNMQNAGTLIGQSRVAVFDGTVEELIA